MEFRNVNTSNLTFKYPVTWEKEKADTYNNPDCVATLSKGEENLLNVVMFPTRTNIEDYKLFMEDAISDDGGVILESDFVEIAGKHAIKTHANMDTPDINFDIPVLMNQSLSISDIFTFPSLNGANTDNRLVLAISDNGSESILIAVT